jgi:branched-chain amino acid transport system ATP-binding protein
LEKELFNPNMQNDLLNVNDLIVGYEGLQVLHGVSLHVSEGEAVALVGANGAGKTTLLKAIMGVVPVSSGKVLLGDKELTGMHSPQIAQAGVALVPEGREVFPNLSVEENLVIGAWVNRRPDLHVVYDEAYELFPRLKERRRQKAGTLSGGEQQMLAVARALMSNPKLLLIDEPSMGLAPLLVKDVYEALRRINLSGTAIFLVEQNVRLALDACERGYVMERGVIAIEGVIDELRKEKRVLEAYLGIVSV